MQQHKFHQVQSLTPYAFKLQLNLKEELRLSIGIFKWSLKSYSTTVSPLQPPLPLPHLAK